MSPVSAVVPSEARARTVYEFVDARLDQELRAEYPTADSEPVVDAYRVRLGEAQAAHRGSSRPCTAATRTRLVSRGGELGGIAERGQAHPDFPGPFLAKAEAGVGSR
ncbi:hypothetical protein QA995_42650 [Streptomyces scabiei]|uniref:hypothetical protein n=1 Tax=Streptomyces scabiei TaxID=1930 RepID=UPI002FEFD5AF